MQHYDDWITRFEESILAILLADNDGRFILPKLSLDYGFNSGWSGALEIHPEFYLLG